MAIDVEEYYCKYGPMVLRRCRFLLKEEQKALDAMQEVFVKLLISKERLKGDYPSSLLFRIATNVCLNILKKKAEQVEIKDEVLMEITSYEDTEKKVVLNDFLKFIFAKEKVSTKEMAVMHYVDKMTFEEVAEIVGMSVSGVRKRLREFKARVEKLKES